MAKQKSKSRSRKPGSPPHDLIWTAAVIDCEGSIQLHLRENSAVMFFLQVNTDDQFITERLKQICGGAIYQFRARYGNKETRMQNRWVIRGENAYALLQAISPYLLSKRHHAELIEEIQRQTSKPGKLDTRSLRNALIEFKTLSHKGYKTSNWDDRVQKYIEKLTRADQRDRFLLFRPQSPS